jgi:hypothetical protein
VATTGLARWYHDVPGVHLGRMLHRHCETGSTCVQDLCVDSALPGEACDDGAFCLDSDCTDGVCAPRSASANRCACGG